MSIPLRIFKYPVTMRNRFINLFLLFISLNTIFTVQVQVNLTCFLNCKK